MVQNRRGTGVKTGTTGSMNPGTSVGIPTLSGTPGSHAIRPSATHPTNSKAIEASQNGGEHARDAAQK
jgi:hypothetical protein